MCDESPRTPVEGQALWQFFRSKPPSAPRKSMDLLEVPVPSQEKYRFPHDRRLVQTVFKVPVRQVSPDPLTPRDRTPPPKYVQKKLAFSSRPSSLSSPAAPSRDWTPLVRRVEYSPCSGLYVRAYSQPTVAAEVHAHGVKRPRSSELLMDVPSAIDVDAPDDEEVVSDTSVVYVD